MIIKNVKYLQQESLHSLANSIEIMM